MRSPVQPRWLLGLVVATVIAVVPADPVAAATEITVAGGYRGLYVPDRSVPVTVGITADRLLQGVLEVTVRPQAGPDQLVSRVRVPVEVAGGSTKSFLVVAPPVGSFGQPGSTVSARVLDGRGDAVAASERQSLHATAGDELVGVLPGALDRTEPPAAAPLAVEAGVARFVKLGRAELAQAPASLEVLGTIAAGPDDLASLAAPVRQGLLRWLGDGGNLLVDAAPGSSVDGLPPAWQPGPQGHGAAGLGRVRLTAGAMGEGRWDRLVEPSTAGSGGDERGGFVGFGGPPGSIGDALAVDAGLRVPAIGGLLAFLVVYVVVVGPVTAVVLRRRRRSELAWVVIPVIAVVFTAGSYVSAEELRQDTKLAHGTALEFDALGVKATTFVGVAARGRQTTEVSFPGAWTASANPSTVLSRFSGQLFATSAEVTRRGPAARLDLGAGQFGVASGVGAPPSRGGLEVTATSSGDGQAEGTVRNRMPYPLEDAAVFVGSAGTSVGRLEPGEERPWAVAAAAGGEHGVVPPEFRVWSSSVGGFDTVGRFGPVAPDSVVNFPLWQVVAHQGLASRPTGVALAVGWTREHRPEVDVDGQRRQPVGRTAVMARAPVQPTGRITDMSMRGDTVRGVGGAGFVEDRGPRGGGPPRIIERWTLPAGAAPSGDLVATIPDLPGVSEVWLDGRWQVLQRLRDAVGDERRPGVIQAVPGAVRGRAFVAPQAGPVTTAPGPAPAPTPAPAAPTTTVVGPTPPPPPMPAPPPFVAVGPVGPFGPASDYAVPAAAVRDGVVFLRIPFTGGPELVTTKLREAAR